MKNYIVGSMLCLSLLVGGCKSETDYGPCVGMRTDVRKNPNLLYDFSIRNIVVGFLFSESVIIPILVVTDYLECPIGRISGRLQKSQIQNPE